MLHCLHRAVQAAQLLAEATIEFAREQDFLGLMARGTMLRAAMSLIRLWQQQSRRDDAQQMLAAVYGWFTEGFDPADLLETKVLLDDLASKS
jgi:predicted ATPase